MKMILPKNVSYIIKKLEEAGYEAYAVGGCVRDTILGRTPEDWDITTSARPFEIKSCFKRTIDTGIQHGTVTVMLDHTGYEVTTYRIDGEYEDNRHPKSVEFTNKLCLDLERRDFTINAMAYNETAGLVDEFGGVKDLENGIIRCVGDAGQRFDEDALRMLRAVRFSGQLGFDIDGLTKRAITQRAGNLAKISAERIRTELSKLIISKNSGQIREAYNTGMTSFFLPELDNMMKKEQHNPHHIYTVGEHCIYSTGVMNYFFGEAIDESIYSCIPDKVLEWAEKLTAQFDKKHHIMLCMTMLLHDAAKPEVMTFDENGIGHFYGHPQKGEEMAGNILRRLTFDNDTVSIVKRLIKYHDYRFEANPRILRRAVAKIGSDIMPMLFLVQYADVLSQNPVTFNEKLLKLEGVINEYEKLVNEEVPLCIKDLKVNGKDIIELGISQGPRCGEILHKLLDMVLEEPEKNQRDILIKYIKDNEM